MEVHVLDEVPDEEMHPKNGEYGYERSRNLHDVWYIIQVVYRTHDHQWRSEIWTRQKKHATYAVKAKSFYWSQRCGSQRK